MSGNNFTIYTHWNWRPESASEIGQKTLQTLDALSAIDPHFSQWCFAEFPSEIREDSLPLSIVRSDVGKFVEGWMDDADQEPESRGYLITAFNSNENPTVSPFSVSLQVHAGGGSKSVRYARLETSYGEVPDPSIVSYPVFKSALTALIRAWNVSYARVFSHELANQWDDPPLKFDLNWMTYLSAPLAGQITAPRDIHIERTDGGGVILIASDQTFDAANPSHMAAARRIRDALAPLNNLPQHEMDMRKREEMRRRMRAMGFQGRREGGR
jgi:hypothetical protein